MTEKEITVTESKEPARRGSETRMAEEQLIDDELLDLKPVAHLRAKAAALLALTLLLILGPQATCCMRVACSSPRSVWC